MNKEEFLKAIENLPKTDSINSISSYNSINIKDLANAVERFKKIPTYDELLKENKQLKEKYVNAVSDYETTMFEKEQLNSLVNSCQEKIRQLKKQLEEYENELEKADSITQSCIFNGKKESEISFRKCLNMLEKHKNQQKEFIEYLENEIKERNIQMAGYHPNTQLLIGQIIKTEEMVLSKYKEIIGSDINVGSKGDKE